MRYLITGATGLVGSHLLDRLLEQAAPVRALVRRPEAAAELARRGVDARLADLGGESDLGSALEGIDVLIHCAGVIETTSRQPGVWEVNVGGTQRLLSASVAAGLPRFIHLSSVAVYGPASSPIREDAPKIPLGAYGESKWAAEKALWRCSAEEGLTAVALRPCVIYGERDRHAGPVLRRLAKALVLPLPRGGARLLDLVHVSDVVSAVLSAAQSAAAAGNSYNITDGEEHNYREIFAAHAALHGRRPAIARLPRSLFSAARLLSSSPLARPLGRNLIHRLQRIAALDRDLHYSIEAARRDLQYVPRIRLSDGLLDPPQTHH